MIWAKVLQLIYSMTNKEINYYIFNEEVVSLPYDYMSFKSKLSVISNFYYDDNINGLLIQNLITNKHFRNKGYATKLLNYVIANYPNQNIYLYVLKSNKYAIAFYKKRNYKEMTKTNNTIIFKLN